MFFNAFSNDVTDARMSSTILLQHVLTQSNVIREIWSVAADMLHLQKLPQCVFVPRFLQTVTADTKINKPVNMKVTAGTFIVCPVSVCLEC